MRNYIQPTEKNIREIHERIAKQREYSKELCTEWGKNDKLNLNDPYFREVKRLLRLLEFLEYGIPVARINTGMLMIADKYYVSLSRSIYREKGSNEWKGFRGVKKFKEFKIDT